MGQSALPHDPVFVAGHFGWECLGLVAGIEKSLVPACDRDGTCLPDIFGQWYANRYIHFGPQLPFALMVVFIAVFWAVIFFWGLWRDQKRSV